jgi:hypothetical protein
MRNFFKKNDNPEDENLFRSFSMEEEDSQKQEVEKKPEFRISEDLEEKIENYDEAINEKRSDYKSLNDLIEKTIRTDWRHKSNIENMKVSKEEELSDKYDRSAYAEVGFKKWVLSKIPLVGTDKERYLREGMKVYDKKGLRQEEKENQTEKVVGMQEKAEMAVKEEIPIDEFYALSYKKRYTETDEGFVKIIERDATESEKGGEARTIFMKEMEGWKRRGESLILKKERLEKHKKDSGKFEELLSDDMISEDIKSELTEKTKEEQGRLEEDIEFEEEMLRDEIENYKESFVEERENSAKIIEEFSLLIGDVKKSKKELADKVKKLQKNIRTAEKLQILGDTQTILVEEFREQMEQTEFDIKEITLREEALNQRLDMAKSFQLSLDGLIRDMDSIGKTRAELKHDKNTPPLAGTGQANEDEKDNESSKDDESARHEDDEEVEKDEAELQKAQNDAENDDENKNKAQKAKNNPQDDQKNNQTMAQTVKDPGQPENTPIDPDKKEPEKKKVGDILERIGIKKKKDKAAARQYFTKPNQKFDRSAEVDFNEAKQMYLNFLYDYRKIYNAEALDEEEKKLKRYFGIDED